MPFIGNLFISNSICNGNLAMIREIATKYPMWVWFTASMIFYAGGEYLSKSWGYKPSIHLGLSVVGCYLVGTIGWLAIVLHRNEIARMSMIWQVVTTILSMFVGIVLLSEKMSVSQWVGAGLGLVGLYLLSR